MRRAVLMLCCVACSPDEPEETVDPLSWAVDAPGPYNVGYRSWEHTYEPLPGESRTILINAWYPTDDSTGEPVKYLGLLTDEDSLGGAAPAAPVYAAGYPVHAYSHGDQGFGGTSADLMRWYASHGWIAVAPDHTDNLLTANADPTPQGHYYHRPLDVQQAIQALRDEPELGPLSDASSTLISGHSRGVGTVWSLIGGTFDLAASESYCPGCSADQLALFSSGALAEPTAVAALPLAGTINSFFGADGHASVQLPVLSMTGSEDGVGQQEQWDQIEGIDFAWVDIEGGCHQTFALGEPCSTLDPAIGYPIVDTYALAWGRAYVLGDADPTVLGIVDGSIPVDERATLQRK